MTVNRSTTKSNSSAYYETPGPKALEWFEYYCEEYGFRFEPGRIYLTQYPRVTFTMSVGGKLGRKRLKKKTAVCLQEAKLSDRNSTLRVPGTRQEQRITLPYIDLVFTDPDDPQNQIVWMPMDGTSRYWRAAFQSFRPLEWHKRYQNYLAKIQEQ